MRLSNFEEHLVDWNKLRNETKELPLEKALYVVNDWWCFLPMDNQYLHFDDLASWPDPWDLINDGVFDNLAKALGIAYTLILIDHTDIQNIEIGLNKDHDTVVIVNNGDYILNWSPKVLLNINSEEISILKKVDSSVIKQRIH